MSDDKDIKHGWKNVARRMQSVSKSGGLSLVSIVVLVDSNGDPQLWTSPSVKNIEPKMASHDILALIHKSDLLGSG